MANYQVERRVVYVSDVVPYTKIPVCTKSELCKVLWKIWCNLISLRGVIGSSCWYLCLHKFAVRYHCLHAGPISIKSSPPVTSNKLPYSCFWVKDQRFMSKVMLYLQWYARCSFERKITLASFILWLDYIFWAYGILSGNKIRIGAQMLTQCPAKINADALEEVLKEKQGSYKSIFVLLTMDNEA